MNTQFPVINVMSSVQPVWLLLVCSCLAGRVAILVCRSSSHSTVPVSCSNRRFTNSSVRMTENVKNVNYFVELYKNSVLLFSHSGDTATFIIMAVKSRH
jgi:hypothetical protein